MIGASGDGQAVRPPSGASSVIRIDGPSSPTWYRFPLDLPVGASASLAADGSVVIDEFGGPVGSFAPPWAKDAIGRSLPTHFSLSGSPAAGYVLSQEVQISGAAFPVLADPHYTWGWISGTVYFNRAETLKGAASAAFIAAIGAFAPPPFDVLLVVSAGSYAMIAGWVVADNRCLEIKSGGAAYEYSGGYCR